jgi:valyl-tRNA synthetase
VAAPVQESPRDAKKKMVSSFGVTRGIAKPTPDMPLAKNTSGKFDLGRNFCNKLWNASRFVLSNLESAPTEAPDETKWSLADRWIVSRFNRTVAEVNAAIADYRFDQIARACYDFFWRDFCDWYVEAVKPAMRDPKRAGQTANVLAAVLDGSLRLLHPVIPFITELVYQRLNEVRPTRGLPGRLECPSLNPEPQTLNPLLIKAPWPTIGSFSEASEHIFPKIQEVVATIRNLRNQYNVPPKQSVTVSIAAPAEPTRQLSDNREVIELLATCTLKDVRPDLPAPANSARASAAGVEIYVEGLIDPNADAARVSKMRDDLAKKIANFKSRLANESYISKAPPKLVQETKDQLAAAEEELRKLS